MAIERTFTIIKPGALQRRLVGEIISRFETKGFRILGMKTMRIPREIAEEHYKEHIGKPFYESLLAYMTSDPAVVMVLERENAVDSLRKLAGATNPDSAEPGTIRGDFGIPWEMRASIYYRLWYLCYPVSYWWEIRSDRDEREA